MKRSTRILATALFLGSVPAWADLSGLAEVRAIYSSAKAVQESDLKVGKLWACAGVSVKGLGPEFEVGWRDSMTLRRIEDHPGHFRTIGPRSIPYELIPALGLYVTVRLVGVSSVMRVAPSGKLVSETYITAQFKDTLHYQGLPASLTEDGAFATGYTVCEARD